MAPSDWPSVDWPSVAWRRPGALPALDASMAAQGRNSIRCVCRHSKCSEPSGILSLVARSQISTLWFLGCARGAERAGAVTFSLCRPPSGVLACAERCRRKTAQNSPKQPIPSPPIPQKLLSLPPSESASANWQVLNGSLRDTISLKHDPAHLQRIWPPPRGLYLR
jgi:hypothetical protein